MPGAEQAEAMAVLGDLTDVTAAPTPPARATFPRPSSGRGGQTVGEVQKDRWAWWGMRCPGAPRAPTLPLRCHLLLSPGSLLSGE